MLTGALPLEASEPVAWVHSHLARQPVAPIERSADIPPVLSGMGPGAAFCFTLPVPVPLAQP